MNPPNPPKTRFSNPKVQKIYDVLVDGPPIEESYSERLRKEVLLQVIPPSYKQVVDEILSNDDYPPSGSNEHWEGWKARRIVDVLKERKLL